MLTFPIKESYQKSQGFGLNPGTYAQFGMKGHNGEDYACKEGTGIYAAAKGFCAFVGEDAKGYGKHVVQICSTDTANRYLYIIYGHMLKQEVIVNEQVEAGQLLGFVDSTGFSTGNHLHFGVRYIERRKPNAGETQMIINNVIYTILDYNNGYFGYVDPLPLFGKEPNDVLAVDNRYGSPYSSIREAYWSFRYNEALFWKQASDLGYSATEFAKMKNGAVYGYWDKSFLLEKAYYPVWAVMTKPEYEKRKQGGTLAGSSPLTGQPGG